MLILKCKNCGKEFRTYPSKIKMGKGKYCSKKCCLSITNKILEKNGEKTRFIKGRMPWSFKGWTLTKARKDKNKTYKLIYSPGHPFADRHGYVREHRFIMERYLGRYLQPNEIIHHLDGDGLNNAISNLQIMLKCDHDRMNIYLNIHRRWLQKAVKGSSQNK